MHKCLLGVLAAPAAALAISSPIHAQAATGATTGIVAGLGLNAATGKTTLGSGAGGIEASLLATDAILAAGAEIRARATEHSSGLPVLVLGRSDTVDLATVTWISTRISKLTTELKSVLNSSGGKQCNPQPTPTPPVPGGSKFRPEAAVAAAAPAAAATPQLGLADVSAALATDISISPITVSEDDRVLESAVASPIPIATDGAGAKEHWVALGQAAAPASASKFRILGEIAAAPMSEKGGLLADYDTLQQTASLTAASCTTSEAKAAVSEATAFVSAVSSASKGQAPIMLAAELDQFKGALVLRVVIEQVGGTAITRSNIWYSLGFPGAATVSSGLVASYRLADPKTGEILTSGLLRCFTKPTDITEVQTSLSKPSGQTCHVAASPSTSGAAT